MGFRVAGSQCAGGNSVEIGFFAEPSCCCKKGSKGPVKSCDDFSCVMPRGAMAQSNFNSPTQQISQAANDPAGFPSFAEVIRPVILESIPHVTLPPPISGRDIGILHQTFLI
ncbi:hypothetical protein GCM10023183_27900 [Nibribacter koreensis]|uniref:Uncharacterized protein n=1 Tax=Nibribacter koreensis TaxID=1084519 RepID=A0ABP8FSS0_9BACT